MLLALGAGPQLGQRRLEEGNPALLVPGLLQLEVLVLLALTVVVLAGPTHLTAADDCDWVLRPRRRPGGAAAGADAEPPGRQLLGGRRPRRAFPIRRSR